MDFHVTFKVNSSIYLRDPEVSELGKQIVKHAIDLIYELGFENFTFKKLAIQVNTTEASIYRYFENKHRLLLYILNWYWSYIEFLMDYRLQNLENFTIKLQSIIDLLTHELPESSGEVEYNKKFLNRIAIAESSKVYLVKEVTEINKNEVFKPYKDLCATIASVISAYNPAYKYPRSLSSTLIETSHNQQYFSSYLPRLTDVLQPTANKDFVHDFLSDFIFKVLDK